MADEDQELEEQEGEGGDGDKPAKGGGKGKLIAIVALVAVAGGGFFAYRSMGSGSADAAAAEDSSEPEEDDAPRGGSKLIESGGLFRLEPLLVNLADTEKNRFLRAEIQLVFSSTDDSELIAESDVAKAKIQDVTLNLLSNKHSSDIDTPQKRITLREELQEVLKEEALEGIRIADVLLTDFIIQ